MPDMRAFTAVMATFEDIHAVIGLVRSLREEGCEEIQIFGPIMEQDLEDALAKPPSPVRRYAIIGAITGCISGFALTIWSSYYYPLVVGGKSLASIPSAIVIAFEMTILFAGISALMGMMIHNRMPARVLHHAYRTSFSDDTFGVRVVCDPSRISRIEEVLRSYGPHEVRVEK